MSIQTTKDLPKGQNETNFYISGFGGLLNINSMPQSVGDDDLTICQNFYGSLSGGVYMRKGIAARGSVLEVSSVMKGLFRFEQLNIDGVAQNPTVVRLMGQVGSSLTAGGDLWNVDADTQVGASNVLGATAMSWSATQIYDPDHTLPTPGAPTANAPSAGGSLSAGIYLASVTWVNAAGETLRGPDVTISGVPGSGQFTLTQAAPPIGAVSWNAYVSTAGGNRTTETLQNAAPIAVATTTLVVTALGSHGSPPSTSTALAASDVMVICTGSGGPYAYDGTNVYVPAAWSTNCANARYCDVVNDILWFGGISAQTNLVVGMALGHPETVSLGGQNTFAVSHPVTGLGTVGAGTNAGLVIGMTQGISTLYGTGLQTFYMQETVSEDGVAAGATMITQGGYLYFLGRDDIYVFDGASLTGIGQKVRPYILNDPLYNQPWDVPMAGARSISWAMYYNRRIYFWYDYTNVGHPNAALVWDLDLRGWTTILGEALSCATLLNASSDGSPLACVVGGATAAQCYNFDVYNGTGHNVDDAGTAINAIAQTKFFKVGQPDTLKQLLRVYPEIFSEVLNAFVTINVDYVGNQITSNSDIVEGINGAIWDSSKWDSAVWSSGFLTYSEQRFDFLQIPFKALSLGMQSLVVQAPFWVQAFGGRFSQNPMV